MPEYIEVAFPTAVRKPFTYSVPSPFREKVQPGQRVWVPFRNYYAIGIVVDCHSDKPSFKTKELRKILDTEPVLSEELLHLTGWVSRFYYSGTGESIQAALPAGLNFISRKNLRVNEKQSEQLFSAKEEEIIDEVRDGNLTLNEAKKRWKGTSYNKILSSLLRKKVLEIWEEPDMQVTVATEREWHWAEGKDEASVMEFLNREDTNTSHKWVQALQALLETGMPVRQSDLDNEIFSSYTLRKLQDEAFIEYQEVEKESDLSRLPYEPESIKELNEEQESAAGAITEALDHKQFSTYLLYGITGSGKTEVYIHALKRALEQGRGGIVLVPEIALTPQTVSRFYRIFGDEIAVLHSRMTGRERLRAWKDLKSGDKNIAIGPRSAVFAPVRNPGIIILDEEHDGSYKQVNPAPRYHARETAIMRASLNDAVVVMGSATPSMQTLNMAAKGKCTLLELTKRHADARLPEVEIIDLKQYKGAMRGDLSVALFNAIDEALKQGEQVILLYNRRGFASYMQCENCGHIPQSPECAVSLTYHKRANLLKCHYSGYARKADTHCEECGSPEINIMGGGTQKIEEQLEELFPDAKTLRFDRDSTSRKGSHEQILNTFGAGDADILVGTQLVAKGLDFPNVTVVGVINADTEEAFPSFQSTERMYQLLSQVSGRSGRGDKAGKVFIQTRQPDNPAIRYARQHDHKGFAREEMGFRKPLDYPPFSRLVRFICKATKEQDAERAAHALNQAAEQVVPEIPRLGPSPGAIPWVNKKYIWELLLKVPPEKGAAYLEALNDHILNVYNQQAPDFSGAVRININVDAIQ